MTREPAAPLHQAPEHDWSAAAVRLLPILRSPATAGTRLEGLRPEELASEGLRSHAQPVLDDGPAGLSIAYAIRADGFDALVNADHLLEWGIEPPTLRMAALRNLEAWSAATAWTDEAEGGRRILSSDSGDGADSSRILLPEVRRRLEAELGGTGRLLVGLPDRHLLLAVRVAIDDGEFVDRFADFVAGHAAAADEPVDGRVFELVGGELRPFAW